MRITGGRVYDLQEGFVERDLCTDGRLIAPDSGDGSVLDAAGCYVIPGLTDLHFHGCKGFDFSDGDAAGLAAMAEYELSRSGQVVEQVIRPTGLLDPEVVVRPVEGQIDDLIGEINARTAKDERILVTTLTKKMAEDLTAYLENAGIKVRYMHHDIKTIERQELVRDLRLGVFDVLVGINLLREGLGYPDPRAAG